MAKAQQELEARCKAAEAEAASARDVLKTAEAAATEASQEKSQLAKQLEEVGQQLQAAVDEKAALEKKLSELDANVRR